MKNLVIQLALITSSAYAGSFVKIDKGNVSWSLNVKSKKGQITLTRYSTGTEGKDLSTDEQIKITNTIGWYSGLGTIANEQSSFENSDERSQETVSSLIKQKMLNDLARLNIELKNSEINIENLNCKESGFIKKTLNCTAQYESKLDVELK